MTQVDDYGLKKSPHLLTGVFQLDNVDERGLVLSELLLDQRLHTDRLS